MGLLGRMTLAALVLAALAGAAPAGPAKDPLLDHMVGRWVLKGTIAGKATTHDVDAHWVLQDEYMRLREVSREKDAGGRPQYEAIGLVGYDKAKARYVCFWFDNTGIASPGSGATARREGNTLPFVFPSREGDFHTTFVYDAKTDSWAWRMDGEKNGTLQPFARVTLTRR